MSKKSRTTTHFKQHNQLIVGSDSKQTRKHKDNNLLLGLGHSFFMKKKKTRGTTKRTTGGNGRLNPNGNNPVYPNTGPTRTDNSTIFKDTLLQNGGNCSSCSLMNAFSMSGGQKLPIPSGIDHPNDCKCRLCEKKTQRGGSPYPNGLVGSPWSAKTSDWPGVDGIPGNRNHYPLNTYEHGDPQREMKGGRRKHKHLFTNTTKRKRKHKHRGRQKGGTVSNFIGQDLINLGRQFQFGIGSAYNALVGYSAPTNPLPWKDQMTHNSSVQQAKL
jgi:hypothetical protein